MSQASKPISSSGAVANIVRRELAGYFATPVAWVFIVIFLSHVRCVHVLHRFVL
jgi:hypothetical protein